MREGARILMESFRHAIIPRNAMAIPFY